MDDIDGMEGVKRIQGRLKKIVALVSELNDDIKSMKQNELSLMDENKKIKSKLETAVKKLDKEREKK